MLPTLRIVIVALLSTVSCLNIHAQRTDGSAVIIDSRHYSQVLGEMRNFRVFLPPSYKTNATKRFPVIYFMHGWSQRSFGDGPDAYASFDKGADNNGDNIANYVAKHDVIIIKSDGYNRSDNEDYYVRPYNVSPVETYRQFPIYFPELIEYVDHHYRTIRKREQRGISGLSMGGFMTFWIAAKYPHLFSAAGSFCGSPEFSVGPKDFPAEYRHIDMFKNFEATKVRLNYGDKDFIRGYHEDMNRVWPHLMDNYEYKIYDAEHSTAGMSEMFDFIMNAFQKPLSKPAQWSHTDVYPRFSAWDYYITSDRNIPGFTTLERVDKRGFRIAVRRHLSDGELLRNVNLTVTTGPVYEKNAAYSINDIDVFTGTSTSSTIFADENGRLNISVNGSEHEIGINKQQDKPNLSIASFHIAGSAWITQNKRASISLHLLNKGASPAKNLHVSITGFRNNVQFTTNTATIKNIEANRIHAEPITFDFAVNDTADVVKLLVSMKDGNSNSWSQSVVMPLRKDVPLFTDVAIADGRMMNVVTGGKDSQSVLLGNGNGDGIANPGESIVILIRDSNRYYKTDLLVSDPYVNPAGTNQRKSDDWTYFDYVGGSAKYDVPLISSTCPEGHIIKAFAEYWTPQYPLHIIHQGKVELKITGKDQTPPLLESVSMQPDNTIEVSVLDGSQLKEVSAKLILHADTTRTLGITLLDDGMNGDRTKNDLVFSKMIPEQKFGIYRVIIQATDTNRNTKIKEWERHIVVR